MNLKGKFKDLAILTIVLVGIQLLLSSVIYPLIPGVGVTQNIYSITPQTALTSPTIGNKIIGVLTGIIPFNLGNFNYWIVLFLGAFSMVLAGYFVYDQKFAWKGKNIYQRLFAILLYGTAFIYVVLLITKWSSVSALAIPLAIGLGINYFLIAGAVVLLAKTKIGKFIRI